MTEECIVCCNLLIGEIARKSSLKPFARRWHFFLHSVRFPFKLSLHLYSTFVSVCLRRWRRRPTTTAGRVTKSRMTKVVFLPCPFIFIEIIERKKAKSKAVTKLSHEHGFSQATNAQSSSSMPSSSKLQLVYPFHHHPRHQHRYQMSPS